MRIALGADHAGAALKDQIKEHLTRRGFEYHDFGTVGSESVDYPDFAAEVGQQVAAGAYDLGVLVCGTGIGMAIAANKVAGVRAAPVVDPHSAVLSREHNDANVLALGARVTPQEHALQLLDLFLDTPFAGGRHQRRIDKITALEQVPR
jgi:ribose 5-phosphate isomerase B